MQLCIVLTLVLSQEASRYIGQWKGILERAAEIYCLDPNLMASVMWHESQGIHPTPLSSAGATGLFQVMPSDNQVIPRLSMPWRPNVVWLQDPVNNTDYAGRILRQLIKKYGNWREALALYNCGERNLYRGTCGKGGGWEYADKVLNTWRKWRWIKPLPLYDCFQGELKC